LGGGAGEAVVDGARLTGSGFGEGGAGAVTERGGGEATSGVKAACSASTALVDSGTGWDGATGVSSPEGSSSTGVTKS